MSVQYLPCNIDADDTKINLESYFNPCLRKAEVNTSVLCPTKDGSCIQSGSTELLSVGFRGRPLKGINISMPTGHSGFVITTPAHVHHDYEDDPLPARVERRFSDLTLWNLSDVPAANKDPFTRAMDWLDIARAIHKEEGEQSDCEEVVGERRRRMSGEDLS